MLVYRDGRRCVAGRELFAGLQTALAGLHESSQTSIVDALLRAGELECALADAASGSAARLAAITDRAADALLGNQRQADCAHQTAGGIVIPASLTLSPPEGFAYYALHPLAYADLFDRVADAPRAVAVLGIRSIGTTLSAVVAAAARRRGCHAERVTVRPTGHPWDRQMEFTEPERAWTCAMVARDAHFFVVDEGPGLSGSSFLAVAEALEREAVPRERITLLASHDAQPQVLCARDAVHRWPRFICRAVASGPRRPAEAVIDIGGGQWRNHFAAAGEWPACWPPVERAKFLSADRRHLFKFEGLGRYGSEPVARAAALAGAGFAPPVADAGGGFAAYPVLRGERLSPSSVNEALLRELARYCALRRELFATNAPCDSAPLVELLRVNVREELGLELESAPEIHESRGSAVIVDGRMQPHEWIRLPGGCLQKFDAASHGDDHFYPGPTDIAWDLAGAIVEWRMAPGASEFFVDEYCALSGDDAIARLPFFLAAYAGFRVGWCRMGEGATSDVAEKQRLKAEAERNRALLSQYVLALHASGAVVA